MRAALAVVVCVAVLSPGVRIAVAQTSPLDAQVQPFALASDFTGTRVYVNASLNGHPGLFELDTASSDVYVDDDFAASAGLEFDSGRTVRESGVAYRIRRGTAGLRIGAFAAASVPVHAIPLHRTDGGRVVAGLLGLGPLAESALLIDFERRAVELCTSPGCSWRCADVVPLVLDRSKPRISVLLGEHAVSALIDSGYPRDLFVYPSFARSLALREGGLLTYGPGIGGRRGTSRAAWAPALTIGSRRLNGLVADVTHDPGAFGATDLDLVVGIGVLRRLRSVMFAPSEHRFGYGACSFSRSPP